MSNNGPPTAVGRTLAGGVQDVAAILPLIGTEQCEKHIGSALKDGYLYAAAAPLSIFGSLGIVKAGIAILMSSISISGPNIWIWFGDYKPYVKIRYLGQQKWLGGRKLKDAGFELTGVVAPLISMDGDRFRAETRLMEMLEEKHIDNPEKLRVNWKSRRWNKMLVISTILCAALSLTPYIALLLGPESWRPNGIHLPWIFPALRIVGSCIAAIASQFLIQIRVISLMKNRILFMIICQRLQLQPIPGERLEWDEDLPAEQCIWNLEQYLVKKPQDRTAIQQVADPLPEWDSDYISIPVLTLPRTPRIDSFDIHQLRKLQREHFPTPTRDAVFTTLLWILLGLSLPAAVAGYIGCFTLVGATPTQGNGPLIWAGLEATLSVLRIFIWASTPSFDEETGIALRLELSDAHPIFPTDGYNPSTANLVTEDRKPLTLVPEREFLERMTPFTGPLDQFPRPNNITLYFTLISESNHLGIDMSGALLMTVFDLNMQHGVSFGASSKNFGIFQHRSKTFGESQPQSEKFDYWDVTVKYDTVLRKFQAHIQSEKKHTQPWRLEDDNLFSSLQKYYQYIFDAFAVSKDRVKDIYKWSSRVCRYSELPLQWDISTQAQTNDGFRAQNPINKNSQHVDHIQFEYQGKSQLIITWASWIVKTMGTIQSHTRIDCRGAMDSKTSQKGTWELAEIDTQLVWEWTNRELVLLTLSLELEDILHSKMETCANEIRHVRQDEQVMTWMRADFESGRQKRMEQEREAAKQRMEREMTNGHLHAKLGGWHWLWQENGFSPQWTQAIEFIERQWSAGINDGREGVTEAEDELKRLIQNQGEQQQQLDNERFTFVEHKKQIWNEHWRHQHRLEEDMMKATVEHICTLQADSTRGKLDMAYKYPEADEAAGAKFVRLSKSSSKGKACTATVYDASVSDQEAVYNVIAKTTTRSVINVNPKFVASIPPNHHLLFLQSPEAKEPAFVKRNRDRWWDQQTGNAAMFYFSPVMIAYDSFSCGNNDGHFGLPIIQPILHENSYRPRPIAHILVFLTGTIPSAVQVGVFHSQSTPRPTNLSIQENGQELASISTSKLITGSFRLDNCQSFVLQPGKHELELVPDGYGYNLRDIFITISDIPTADYPTSGESDQGAFTTIRDSHSEGRSSSS